MAQNESISIPAARLENSDKRPLIIEIQIGSYLDEDDIVRSDNEVSPSALGEAF